MSLPVTQYGVKDTKENMFKQCVRNDRLKKGRYLGDGIFTYTHETAERQVGHLGLFHEQ